MSSPSIQNLTPEEVVFRTNSDEESIILIFNDKVVYAFPGEYGGYVIRGERLLGVESLENVDVNTVQSILSSARAFYVEPKKTSYMYDKLEYIMNNADKLANNDKYRPILQYLDLIKREAAKLPEEVVETIYTYGYAEIVEYTYVEVNVAVKKVAKKSVVIDVNPKPHGLKLSAKAIRVICRFACRGCGTENVRKWKLKYPENEYLQKYIYDTDDRTLIWKIVVEAPQELVPTAISSVVPATQQQQQTQSIQTQQMTPVLINGFLVISTLPSKALLDAHLPEIFKDIKIGTKEIKLVTGYFYNKLGTLSRKFYNFILPEYAIDAGFGYIVPKSKVGAFLAKIEELKQEYAEFERQLKDFLLYGRIPEDLPKRARVERRYLEIVMEYLKQHGKDEEVRKKIEALNITERVRIHLLPFAVDMSVLYEYADERVRKELEEEIKALKEQIVAGFRERIKEYIEALNAKLQKLAVAEVRRELLEKARREIEEMERTAKELGIEIKELEVLKEMLTPEKVEELAVKAAEGRLRALIEF